MVERGRPQMAIWLMRIACRITKATYTHSEYVIPIVFSPHQRVQKPNLVLRYTYIGCLVVYVYDSVAFAGTWVCLAVVRLSDIRVSNLPCVGKLTAVLLYFKLAALQTFGSVNPEFPNKSKPALKFGRAAWITLNAPTSNNSTPLHLQEPQGSSRFLR
jgi:hypothetical protein